MEKGKPGLMIAVMDGLKKKGKLGPGMSPKPEMDEDEEQGDSSKEHLLDISKDLIAAIHDQDAQAVADLLEEAFECLDAQPHEEGPHIDSDEESKY